MKHLLLFIAYLIPLCAIAQTGKFKVGEVWPYNYAYVRTTPDSIELHKFEYAEGLATVTYNNRIGFIDSSRTIIIPLIYEYGLGANKFINSRCIVVKDGFWGVIDTLGNQVIPFKYGNIRTNDSLFCVSEYEGYQWGYLDFYGNTILPLGTYGRSSIMTTEEVNDLAEDYAVKDSLEKSTAISKKKAISIAKRNGYYWEEDFPFAPSVILDSTGTQWVINSAKRGGVSYQGDCANTNGCTITIEALIIIDATTGKVLEKSKHTNKLRNYE